MSYDQGFARGWLAAWNAHDPSKVVAFFTDDCVYVAAAGTVFRGIEENVEFAKSTFLDYPDFHLEFESWFASGNCGACEYVMSGTHAHSSRPGVPATGKRFSLSGVSILEFRDGKICRQTDYINQLSILEQLGLIPALPQR